MDKEISLFISANNVATVCCINGLKPYCFNCFYFFEEENHWLLFKSSPDSFHSQLLNQCPDVAGSILPARIKLTATKGIQFSGTILCGPLPGNANPRALYHRKFPFALTRTGKVWCIQLNHIKMTDSTLSFGKKSVWIKEAVS